MSTSPATRLPSERELSQQLGANRTTIREGLAQLEHQGLIERRQGARCRVLDYRRTGSIELLPDLVRLSRNRRSRDEPSPLESTNEVLRIIYEGALDLAFERITAAEIAQLDRLASDVEMAAAAGDVVARASRPTARSTRASRARRTRSRSSCSSGSFYRVVDSAAARSERQERRRRQRADRARQAGRPTARTARSPTPSPRASPTKRASVVRRMLGDGDAQPRSTSTSTLAEHTA